MKTNRLISLFVAGVLAACGGGSSSSTSSHKDPTIALDTPEVGASVNGVVTLRLTATGDGVDLKSFVFTAPDALTGTEATLDTEAHTATLEVTLNSMDFPEGKLTVQVNAKDINGQESIGTYEFTIGHHAAPIVTLVTPQNGVTINGATTIRLTATGDGVNVEHFAFTAPPALAGVQATYDYGSHTATLQATINTYDYADGIFSVDTAATDGDGLVGTRTSQFLITSSPRAVTVDTSFLSYYDEQGIQLAQSNGVAVITNGQPQYVYASTSKVAALEGQNIRKIITRLAWTGAAPTASDLRANTTYNLPVMRLLTPHASTDPAITSAQAVVTLGSSSSVTVDLIPDSTNPSGQKAYLLPIASNLIPDLAYASGPKTITVSASIRDALGHSATGGPWSMTLTPLTPPIAVYVDTGYPSTQDPRSVYPYNGQNYAGLWAAGFDLDQGARIYHVVVTNPGPIAVSLSPSLGGANSWSLAESWTAHRTGGSTATYNFGCWTGDRTGGCTGSTGPCSGATPVRYQPAGSSAWSCVASSNGYESGPAPLSVSKTGQLKITAYKSGTTARADSAGGSQLLLPAAAGSTPGRLDLYVVRPLTSDRSDGPTLTWTGSLYEFGDAYKTQTGVQTGSTCFGNNTQSCSNWLWTEYAWNSALASATEAISGSLTLDSVAYSGGAFGPHAVVLENQDLSINIRH